MKQNFPLIMEGIHESEGGYVNHPKDPGGETNLGITQRTLDAARRTVPGPLPQSVRDLTKEQANRIYQFNYWRQIQGDKLPMGVDYVTMDAAVNSGVKRGVQWTQRAAGVKGVDGLMGPVSLSVISRQKPAEVITKACDIRRGFLRGLKTFSTFGRGWLSRVARVEAASLKMAGIGKDVALANADNRIKSAQQENVRTSLASGTAGVGASTIEAVPDWALMGAVGLLAVLLVFVIVPRVQAERIRRRAIELEYQA